MGRRGGDGHTAEAPVGGGGEDGIANGGSSKRNDSRVENGTCFVIICSMCLDLAKKI